MKYFISFNLLIIILISISCKKESSNPTISNIYGTIQGKITNATGDSVIVNAIVSTNPPTSSVTTNTKGEYIINNVP
jgi:hypothetical protein